MMSGYENSNLSFPPNLPMTCRECPAMVQPLETWREMQQLADNLLNHGMVLEKETITDDAIRALAYSIGTEIPEGVLPTAIVEDIVQKIENSNGEIFRHVQATNEVIEGVISERIEMCGALGSQGPIKLRAGYETGKFIAVLCRADINMVRSPENEHKLPVLGQVAIRPTE